MMKWIVITSPDFLSGEALFINRLFCHGLDVLHLRKPGATEAACRHLLSEIPSRWHNRIVVHDHFSLAQQDCGTRAFLVGHRVFSSWHSSQSSLP